MALKMYQDTIEVQSTGGRPTFHNITAQVKGILQKSGMLIVNQIAKKLNQTAAI